MRSVFVPSLALFLLAAVGCKQRNFNNNDSSKAKGFETTSTRGIFGKKITLTLDSGQATIDSSSGAKFAGELEKDGTAGNNFNARPPEGQVCGSLRISRMDPDNEGNTLDDAVIVSWIKPEGSVVRSCGSMREYEGRYAGDASSFKGKFTLLRELQLSPEAYIEAQGTKFDGTLEKEGSAGNSYKLIQPEGNVCGSFTISRYDPDNEGSVLKDEWIVTWNAPDGSVRKNCGKYRAAEGRYSLEKIEE